MNDSATISAVSLSAREAFYGNFLCALSLLANNHGSSLIAYPDLMRSVGRNVHPLPWTMPDALLAPLRQPDLHRTLEYQMRCQLVVRVRLIISVSAELVIARLYL